MNNPLNNKIYFPPYILGLDVGGTKTALVLGTINADVVARDEIPTPANLNFESAMEIICTATDQFLQQISNMGYQKPQAISISIG